MLRNFTPPFAPRSPWAIHIALLMLALTWGIGCTQSEESAREESSPPAQTMAECPGNQTESILGGGTIRLLLVGDPFATALQSIQGQLGALADGTVHIEIVSYDDVRRLTLLNAKDATSAYDLISFDVVWAGEFGAQEIFWPLNTFVRNSTVALTDDFIAPAYRGCFSKGILLGLPIETHAELLWYRTDLFAAQGLAPPATTDDILSIARSMVQEDARRAGICWNAQRGQALGQTMAHLYAAFGQPLLNAQGLPELNTPRGVAAARFALELVPVSPPDILIMAWDQRVGRFASGATAMTYGWGARAYLAEEDPVSTVSGKVGYIAPPHAPDSPPVTAIGTWALGIPANIGTCKRRAWRFLEWLTSPEITRLLAENGNGGPTRHSVLQDAALQQRFPVFAVMEQLSQAGELHDFMRPAVPQWPQLAEILGTVYHDMLSGQLSPEDAASTAQAEAMTVFSK